MLSGVPSAPRGVPQVEVTFDIDANGILNVKAKDKATGKEQSITITASTGLSKEEIEKMKQEAEIHAADDEKKKEMIEVKNTAETILYTTEKMLKDLADKIKAEDKKEIEEKMEALKKVKDTDDKEAIKKAADELAQVGQKVGAAMYQSQQGNPGPSTPGTTEGAGQAGSGNNDEKKDDEKKDDKGKTVEGEYEEVK